MYGFSYRGTHTTHFAYPIHVTKVENSIAPPTENILTTIPAYNGAYPIRQDDRPKYITVSVVVRRGTMAELRSAAHELANWLRTTKDGYNRPVPEPLVFDDDTAKRWMVFVDTEISADAIVSNYQAQVTFIAPGCYAQAETETNEVASGTNEGTEPAPAVITLNALSDDAKVALTVNDFVELKGIHAHPDYVDAATEMVIDTGLRSITIGGGFALNYMTLDSKFFKLPVGAWTLTPTGATVVSTVYRRVYR